MVYRVADISDLPAIQEFVAKQEYFLPVEPCTLGGTWLVAVNDQGEIRGTLWFFHQAPHAYVDYWAGSGMIAAKLGMLLQNACKMLGIEYVRGVIADKNDVASRMAKELFEMSEGGDTYHLVFRSM